MPLIRRICLKNKSMNPKDLRSRIASADQPSMHQADASALDDLRNLLIGPEKQKLAQIEKRLKKPQLNIEDLSHLLPDAVAKSTASDNRLAKTLQPVLDRSIHESVKKNPQVLADAIFPALGPAIRKAISSTILGMIQTLNQILNHSFTVQGLKWRWESISTRRPFAEVIMLHTLVYRVEQIFLIHPETGLVLAHVQGKEAIVQDPDMVSGMLTAIQDFIQDSFNSKTGSLIDMLRMDGDHSVWIEQGPHAIMAAVFRGTPPNDYRNRLRDLLDSIHISYFEALEDFQGDTSPFASLDLQLEDLLRFKLKETREKISPVIWFLLLLTALFLVGLSFHSWRNYEKWQGFVGRVRSEPGLIVTEEKQKNGGYFISGLRDPLAKDPDQIMEEADFLGKKINFLWEPYYCLLPEFIIKRARNILEPPVGVSFVYSNNTLIAIGTADHHWISNFRQKTGGIPGVVLVDEDNLTDTSVSALALARKNLEGVRLFFPLGKVVLKEGQDSVLQAVIKTVFEIEKLQEVLNTPVKIFITGNTDPSGSELLNLQFSRQRAEAVFALLVNNGIHPDIITAVVSSDVAGDSEQDTGVDNALNRNVTFRTSMFERQGNSR